VKEETNYDISPLVQEDQFLEINLSEHRVRLYIAPGVKENYNFQPQTRMEIKCAKWFVINDLPMNKKDSVGKKGHFYMVIPFLRYVALPLISMLAFNL